MVLLGAFNWGFGKISHLASFYVYVVMLTVSIGIYIYDHVAPKIKKATDAIYSENVLGRIVNDFFFFKWHTFYDAKDRQKALTSSELFPLDPFLKSENIVEQLEKDPQLKDYQGKGNYFADWMRKQVKSRLERATFLRFC